MDHVEALVKRYFPSSNSELCIGGMPVTRIVERYGTPLFVYDRRVLEAKWSLLRSVLPPEFKISYSVKANPTRAIIRFFLEKGCGLEVASEGEFHRALWAGCHPARIVFAGPGKSESELRLALSNGIGELHVESLLEIERVSAISREKGLRAPVALRVNPTADAQGGAMRMGGKPSPFGIDEECLDIALERTLSDLAIDFKGIHLFAGTQILDYEVLINQYRKGVEIAKRVATRLGRPVHTLDFGGGLGIPYFQDDRELEMTKLRENLQQLGKEIRVEPLLTGTQFMLEPGRYLVGEAGIYITRVSDIKVSRGKMFVVVDGGMHHHLAASGNLGQTIKRNYPVALANKLGIEPHQVVDIVGPLCTPLDVLARGIKLPTPAPGDLVGIFQSGAYARSASPLGFLSHPTPPEVLVDDGKHHLVRRRGSSDDYLREDCTPDWPIGSEQASYV